MNHEAKVARIALGFLVGFICLAFVPGWMEMDMMKSGYGIIALCVFFCIASCTTWVIFRRRARIVDRFLEGRDILARWEIPSQVWAKHVAVDLTDEKRDKKQLFIIIACWMVVIGAGFVLYDREAGWWVAGVLALILLILMPFAFWMPRWRAARMLKRPTPVVIGREGVYVGDELHDWRLVGSFFSHAEINEKKDPIQLLIHYIYLTGYGVPMPVVVRIPVPPGAEAEAAQVVEQLMTKKGKDVGHR